MTNQRKHPRVSFMPQGKSLTKQSFKAECDINNIIKQFDKTQLLTHTAKYNGEYGDFTIQGDYHHLLNQVQQANEMFLTLPSKIRKEFDNDPQSFLEAFEDPSQKDRLVQLGLLEESTAAPTHTAGKGDSSSPSGEPSEEPKNAPQSDPNP